MVDTPFLLEPRKVAAAVRKAHAENRLGYQRGHEDCLYDYGDGAGCAIGVALPKGLVPNTLMSFAVSTLECEDFVSFPDGRAHELLEELQDRHDAMCRNGASDVSEAEFFRALEACEAA